MYDLVVQLKDIYLRYEHLGRVQDSADIYKDISQAIIRIYIYIYIYTRCKFNMFPDFFVQAFKIVVDS